MLTRPQAEAALSTVYALVITLGLVWAGLLEWEYMSPLMVLLLVNQYRSPCNLNNPS